MKKAVPIVFIIAVLAAAGVWAYDKYFAKAEQPQAEREELKVVRGSLAALVNTTGTILPERQTTLSFKGVGRVAEVMVEEGQSVRAGDLLARLESTDLEYAIAQAELALSSAQAQLLRLERPPSQYDLDAAQAALDSAEAAYQRLREGASEEEKRVARANVDQAKAALDQAQLAYNLVADRPEVAMLPQALQLQQATIAYETAQASYDLTVRGPSAAELAAAQSAITQAKAAMARLEAGVAEEDLLLAQLQVKQAQLSLEQAKHQLEGTTLTAPHDGVITLVGIRPGELTGGQPAFVLTDLSRYHLDVYIDEIDIGQVAVSQPVTVTLDALPGDVLTGRLDQIAEVASLDSGVVTYKATIHLVPGDVALRVGMTANVDILTELRQGALLVPNRFIRMDRTTGQAFVDRLSGDQIQPTEIQIGLRNENSSEVLAGMNEGDVIVLVQESSREQLRRAMDMGAP